MKPARPLAEVCSQDRRQRQQAGRCEPEIEASGIGVERAEETWAEVGASSTGVFKYLPPRGVDARPLATDRIR